LFINHAAIAIDGMANAGKETSTHDIRTTGSGPADRVTAVAPEDGDVSRT
jgi:hypothetical protein